jgi:hypothetical protein
VEAAVNVCVADLVVGPDLGGTFGTAAITGAVLQAMARQPAGAGARA